MTRIDFHNLDRVTMLASFDNVIPAVRQVEFDGSRLSVAQANHRMVLFLFAVYPAMSYQLIVCMFMQHGRFINDD